MLCVHGEWYECYVFMACTLGNDVNVICTWWVVWMLCVPVVYIREWCKCYLYMVDGMNAMCSCCVH